LTEYAAKGIFKLDADVIHVSIEQLIQGNSWKAVPKAEREKRILKLFTMVSPSYVQENIYNLIDKVESSKMYSVSL
jgi:hypothetical protein